MIEGNEKDFTLSGYPKKMDAEEIKARNDLIERTEASLREIEALDPTDLLDVAFDNPKAHEEEHHTLSVQELRNQLDAFKYSVEKGADAILNLTHSYLPKSWVVISEPKETTEEPPKA